MTKCIACGMPLYDPLSIGTEIADGPVCIHCAATDGKVKSCKEVFEAGVKFLIATVPNIEKTLAEKLVRRNMNQLLYWQRNRSSCLDGEEASDEEFNEYMPKS